MNKWNLKIRFNWRENKTFIIRFVIAVFLPVLAYYGYKAEDLTSWATVWDIIVRALSNPYVLVTMVVNALNIIPDPTSKGLSDSENALSYKEPAK